MNGNKALSWNSWFITSLTTSMIQRSLRSAVGTTTTRSCRSLRYILS